MKKLLQNNYLYRLILPLFSHILLSIIVGHVSICFYYNYIVILLFAYIQFGDYNQFRFFSHTHPVSDSSDHPVSVVIKRRCLRRCRREFLFCF